MATHKLPFRNRSIIREMWANGNIHKNRTEMEAEFFLCSCSLAVSFQGLLLKLSLVFLSKMLNC